MVAVLLTLVPWILLAIWVTRDLLKFDAHADQLARARKDYSSIYQWVDDDIVLRDCRFANNTFEPSRHPFDVGIDVDGSGPLPPAADLPSTVVVELVPVSSCPLPEPPILAAIAVYAERMGVSNLNALEGCWSVTLDADWWFTVNGHEDTRAVQDPNGVWCEVPPWTASIYYRGWPAGVADPTGDAFVSGPLPNESGPLADRHTPAHFRAALRAAPDPKA